MRRGSTATDAFPLDPTEWADADGDGIGDNTDPDINGTAYKRADFSRDGRADILFHRNDGLLVMWTMNGSARISGSLVGYPPPVWQIPAV
ncbi:MAG: hypothetical protein AB2826_19400, partial [Candidatus Thiodiazotropha sp.]